MTADLLASLPWKSRGAAPAIVPGERLLLASRHHWVEYVIPVVLYLALTSLCGLLFAVAVSSTVGFSQVLFFTALVALIAIQHWFFHAILSESVTDIVLTNRRTLYLTHSLWFEDSIQDVILDQVNAVEVRKKGVLRHVLNYGDLWFDTGGGAEQEANQIIFCVPSPQRWADAISRIVNTR